MLSLYVCVCVCVPFISLNIDLTRPVYRTDRRLALPCCRAAAPARGCYVPGHRCSLAQLRQQTHTHMDTDIHVR